MRGYTSYSYFFAKSVIFSVCNWLLTHKKKPCKSWMTCCLTLNFSIPYSLSLDVQSSQQVQFRLSENFCFSLELVFLLSELSLSVIKKKKVPNSHLQKNDSHQFQSLQSLRALVQPNNWSQKKKKDQNCVCYLCGFRLVWQPVHDKTSASSFYKYSFARKHRNSWKIPRDIFGCLLISVHFLWQIVSRFTFQL